MITVRPAAERGTTRFDWLDSRHSFSFGEYRDLAHVRFGPLRVINDDRIAPGAGFRPHSHADMEIVTYMLTGALAHEDSLGNRFTIGADEVQRMSAGTGITHSEFNASETEPARLLQIWIHPDRAGLEPSYEQKAFTRADKTGRFRLIAAGRPRDGAMTIHRDAAILASVLEPGGRVDYAPGPGRRIWAQVAEGTVAVNGAALSEGDGAAIEDAAGPLMFTSEAGAEFLIFDLP
jgi:hypothetical protein